jgi:hypothetical protein
VEEGWEIAPGDYRDRKVCLEHPWCSEALVFADGDFAPTSIRSRYRHYYGRQWREKMMKQDPSYPWWQPFVVRQGGMVNATEETYDVLLRLLA